MPLTVAARVLPQSGVPLLDTFLSALSVGQADPPDLIAVGVGAGGVPRSCPALDAMLPASAAELVAAYGHSGKPGETTEAAVVAAERVVRVLFLGTGDESPAALRRAGAELGRRCADGKVAVTDVGASLAGDTAHQAGQRIGAVAVGALLGSYRFSLRSQPAPDAAGEIRLLSDGLETAEAMVRRAVTVASAVATARDLANTPSAGKSPQWLASEAARMTADSDVDVRIWTDDQLAAGGFGGILAVGSGSVRPPRLIELSYAPPGAAGHIVLVGKGITFDSGGLSLKPNDNMKLMKTDMAGGAVVIAVMSALASLGVRTRVTGLVAAAENMPSGSAYRPGDVISQYGGRSVEVLNTDAEGRLVLADALAYAAATLAPDQIVDVATLTGAARVALGSTHAALYATDDTLADALVGAGQASGDLLWRMPLVDEYRESLDSPVAELAHVARDHNPAGSILAALFLREFTGGVPWAHLDIAGAGRSLAEDGELTKGATGFGTRLLLSWLSPVSSGSD